MSTTGLSSSFGQANFFARVEDFISGDDGISCLLWGLGVCLFAGVWIASGSFAAAILLTPFLLFPLFGATAFTLLTLCFLFARHAYDPPRSLSDCVGRVLFALFPLALAIGFIGWIVMGMRS